jgi:hypothetical protein
MTAPVAMPVFRVEVVITVIVERKKVVATQNWSRNARRKVRNRLRSRPRDPWISAGTRFLSQGKKKRGKKIPGQVKPRLSA